MKKLILIALILIILVSCTVNEPLVVNEGDNLFVISVTEQSIGDCEFLIDYMAKLMGNNEFVYTVSNGMITSVNGVENENDFSKFWTLYTSDQDNANVSWGTIEYNGNVYGSSLLGADKLKIKPGMLYFWVYK
ncbi:MAG: hypothetical protein J6V58_01435 [Clostridia bacterium]|nr:hypothetical protein [Clostridia bacterium]